MATPKKFHKVTSQWRHSDVAAGLPRFPDAILHIFFVELFSSQYYSELVFMVFYKKYTPIHSAWRGVFLIFRILIYFAPVIYMVDFDNGAADNGDGATSIRFYIFFLWNYLAFNITLNSWLWYFINYILLFTWRDVAFFF